MFRHCTRGIEGACPLLGVHFGRRVGFTPGCVPDGQSEGDVGFVGVIGGRVLPARE